MARRGLAAAVLFGGTAAVLAVAGFSGRTDPTCVPCGQPGDAAEFQRVQKPRGAPFDLSSTVIPRDRIVSGGVPKDGIPALTDPRMVEAVEAEYLNPDDRVIGVVVGGEARAYPLRILNWHEVVNDRVGDVPVAVTYCPLCDSVAAFDRRTPAGEREFGVSGLLYNSNVLMYDRSRRKESLWSQLMAQGVAGPGAEESLQTLPVELTTWEDWRSRHRETKVLSIRTGYPRNYGANPYSGYFNSPRLMFSASPTSRRLPAKAEVLGIWSADAARAYPLAAFGKTDRRFEQSLDGLRFTLHYNAEARSLRVVEADEGLQWVYSLWFAWYAFHPDTGVFQPGGQ